MLPVCPAGALYYKTLSRKEGHGHGEKSVKDAAPDEEAGSAAEKQPLTAVVAGEAAGQKA
jgi:hypothetical protein